MSTFLFDKSIFGPIKSRRFGNSLGINLLPVDYKLCNLDCIYCECGWTLHNRKVKLASYTEIADEFENYLIDLKTKGQEVDSFTFAGNGEPTLHPNFSEIIDLALSMRDKYYPKANVTVLSNGILINKTKIKNALYKIDLPVMKLDAGTDDSYYLINKPEHKKPLKSLVKSYKEFGGKIVIQTLFLKGEHSGKLFDNSSKKEVDLWVKMIEEIAPSDVMIYSLERDTPADNLNKIPLERLEEISSILHSVGIKASVY